MTVGKIRKIRESLQVDLAESLDPTKSIIDTIIGDPVILSEIIWECCKDSHQESNVSDEEFADGISGEVIEYATEALIGAIIDFFPKSKTELIRQSLAVHDRMDKKIRERRKKRMEAYTDEEIEKMVELLEGEFGKQFLDAQESLA